MALVQRLIVLGIFIAWGPLANATVGDTAKNRSALAAERGMGALGQSTAAAGMAEAFGLRLYQIGSETGLKWGEFGWQNGASARAPFFSVQLRLDRFRRLPKAK